MLPKDIERVKSKEKTTKCDAMEGRSKASDVVFLSRYTNKPIGPDAKSTHEVVFWCGVCCCRVNTNDLNVQHFLGKSHKKKFGLLKRPLPKGTDNIGPAAKKVDIPTGSPNKDVSASVSLSASVKSVPCEVIKCEDCKLEFNSHGTALMHFKGKKHTSVVTQKALKKRDYAERCFLNGRGRGRADGSTRDGPTGRGTDRCDFGYTSISTPNFDNQQQLKVSDNQMDIPSASQGAPGSLLRRKLIRALLEEEERWIGFDGATSLVNDGNIIGECSTSYHDPYSGNAIDIGTGCSKYCGPGSYSYNNH